MTALMLASLDKLRAPHSSAVLRLKAGLLVADLTQQQPQQMAGD